MIRLRGGSGLGDSLYLRPICEHFQAQGDPLTVMTNFPDVFRGTGAITEIFNRNRITITAHYTAGKTTPHTNQWQDIMRSAKLNLPLRFTWNTVNTGLVRKIRWSGNRRPLILVIGGREPMGRSDGFGSELLPRREAFQSVIDELADCYTVRIGQGRQTYGIDCSVDFTDRTSVIELMDVAQECDGIVGQCSYAIPLAEGFDKPLLCVWARAGLDSRTPYISQITPAKILSKETSLHVMDDAFDHSSKVLEHFVPIQQFRDLIGCVNVEKVNA